jgi:1-acyl-sn-glycerol-3-phosphate acyltransferase
MSKFRIHFFLFCFYGWTALFCTLCLLVLWLPSRCITALVHFWAKVLAWLERHIVGIRFQVKGFENIPAGPCIIAAKHQSAWETCKLYLILGDPAVVLKEELTRLPIMKWYAIKTGMIPIDRGARVKALTLMRAAALKAAADGRKIVIFPQGTRLAPGEKKPYKSGVAALYRELQLPIIPMALNSGLFWPRDASRMKSGLITVEFLPPIPAGLERQDMMQRLETQLEEASDRLAGIGSQTASC